MPAPVNATFKGKLNWEALASEVPQVAPTQDPRVLGSVLVFDVVSSCDRVAERNLDASVRLSEPSD